MNENYQADIIMGEKKKKKKRETKKERTFRDYLELLKFPQPTLRKPNRSEHFTRKKKKKLRQGNPQDIEP